jgi:hexosaminidase
MDAPDTAVRFGSLMKRGREWAEAAGIELWSLHVPFARDLDLSSPSEAERQKVVRRLAMCFKGYAPLGVKKLNIHGSYEISKPIPEDERKIRVASSQKSLKELAGKADEIGAQLSLECLPRGCIGNTSAEVLALVAEIPAVGVTLDTNHLLQETPEAFARRVGSRIVNTHVADYDGNDERHWLPGKGIINFAAVVSALEDAGYSGPFMFECAGTPVEKVAVWEKLKKAVAGQRTED